MNTWDINQACSIRLAKLDELPQESTIEARTLKTPEFLNREDEIEPGGFNTTPYETPLYFPRIAGLQQQTQVDIPR